MNLLKRLKQAIDEEKAIEAVNNGLIKNEEDKLETKSRRAQNYTKFVQKTKIEHKLEKIGIIEDGAKK